MLAILTVAICLPAAAALGLALLGRRPPGWRVVTSLSGGAELVLAGWLVARFPWPGGPPEILCRTSWIPSLGVHLSLGVDGLSVALVALVSLLSAACLFAVCGSHEPDAGARAGAILIGTSATIGFLVSLDLLVLCGFLELALVPFFWLPGVPCRAAPRRAGLGLLLFGASGTVPLLLAAAYLGHCHREWAGYFSLGLPELLATPVPAAAEAWLLAAFLIAFAGRMALPPLHAWLRPALAAGGGPAGSFLLGTTVLCGWYGLVRFAVPLAPGAFLAWRVPLFWLGVAGATYGGLVSLVGADAPSRLASIVSAQMGVAFAGTMTGSTQGVQGAALYGMGSVLAAAAFGLGAPSAGSGDRRGAAGLSAARWLAVLGAAGLPGSAAFVGGLLVVWASLGLVGYAGLLLMVGPALLATGVLGLGQDTPPAAGAAPSPAGAAPTRRLAWILAALVMGLLALGCFPGPLLQGIEPAARHLVTRCEPARADAPGDQAEATETGEGEGGAP